MPADIPLLLWGLGNLLWGRLSSLSKNTPPLCSFAFFYAAVWDLPVCLTAASVLCVLSLYTEQCQGTRSHHPHWDAGTATPSTVLTQTN